MYQAMLPNLPASDENKATRYSWKYGTNLGVSGTPRIFVNGVLFD